MPEVEYLTGAEVAKILRVSLTTVLRLFATCPGVVVLGEKKNYGRTRRIMRIPRSSLNKFIAEKQVR